MRRRLTRSATGARWAAAIPVSLLAGVLVMVPCSLPNIGPAAAADAERFAFTGPYRFEDGAAAPDDASPRDAPAAAQPSGRTLEAFHLPPGLIPIRIAEEAPPEAPAAPPVAGVTVPVATESESAIVTSALPPNGPPQDAPTASPAGRGAPGDATRQMPPATADKPPFTAEQRSALGAAEVETAPPQTSPAAVVPAVETPPEPSAKLAALPPAENKADVAADGDVATTSAAVPLPTIGPKRPSAAERHSALPQPARSSSVSKRPAQPQSARLSPATRAEPGPARSRGAMPATPRQPSQPSTILVPTPPWAERAFSGQK